MGQRLRLWEKKAAFATWRIHSLVHSFVCSFTHSLVRSFIRSLVVCLTTPSLTCTPAQPCIHSPQVSYRNTGTFPWVRIRSGSRPGLSWSPSLFPTDPSSWSSSCSRWTSATSASPAAAAAADAPAAAAASSTASTLPTRGAALPWGRRIWGHSPPWPNSAGTSWRGRGSIDGTACWKRFKRHHHLRYQYCCCHKGCTNSLWNFEVILSKKETLAALARTAGSGISEFLSPAGRWEFSSADWPSFLKAGRLPCTVFLTRLPLSKRVFSWGEPPFFEEDEEAMRWAFFGAAMATCWAAATAEAGVLLRFSQVIDWID